MDMQTQPNPVRIHPLDKAAIWSLLGTIILALFFFLPLATVPFIATKSFLIAAGATITLALFILARLTKGNAIVPSTWLVGVLWLPLAGYALSTAFSGAGFSSAFWGTALEPDTFGFMLAVTMLAALAALVVRRREQFGLFMRVSATTFGVLALIETFTLILGRFVGSIPPGFAVVGSMNDLAMVMGLGIIGTLLAFRFAPVSDRTHKWLLISGVAALFVLAVAGSVTVWTLIALTSFGLFVESIMRYGRAKVADQELDGDVVVLGDDDTTESVETEQTGRSLPAFSLGVLAVSLFFLVGSQLGGALANSLHVSTVNVRPSWQSTLTVAQKTYATSALFGSGPGTFGVQWLKYRNASVNTTAFWNINFTSGVGFIPTSFVTTGVVGAIAWIAFLALFIVFGLRTLIARTPEDPFVRYTTILTFVGTLYLFALALFDLPNVVVLALAFVFAGVFVSSTRFAKRGSQLGIIFSRSPKIGFIVVFVFTLVLLSSVGMLYALIGRYVAADQITTAAVALSAGDLPGAESAVNTALSFAPMISAYQAQASIARAELSVIAASSTIDKTTAQKAYQSALSSGINAAITATRLSPSDYQNWLALGDLYAQAVPFKVSGAYASAQAAYVKAQALNPTDAQIEYALAQLAVANNDTKTAITHLQKAIALKQNYTNAILLLSQLEVHAGNLKEALAASISAAYFTPNDPNILFQIGVLYAAEKNYSQAASAFSAAVSANPQFANARYLLAAVYAKQGNFSSALTQMKAVAAMSSKNASAVSSQIDALTAGKDPFPANLLAAPAPTTTVAPAPATPTVK